MGPTPQPLAVTRRAGEAGYAMAALLVAIAVISIVLASALPVWTQVARREREAELVFRGEQYARAIGLFQRKLGPGTLPTTIDMLVSQKFLRRKYKDPITNQDFQTVGNNQIVGLPGATPQGAGSAAGTRPGSGTTAPGSATGQAGPGGQAGQERRPGQNPGGASAPGQPLPGRAAVGVPGQTAGGGIVGVVSTSTAESIRLYNGRNKYNEWLFTFAAVSQAPGQPAGSTTRPGGAGGPAGPQGAQRPGAQPPQGGPGSQPRPSASPFSGSQPGSGMSPFQSGSSPGTRSPFTPSDQ